MDTTGRVLATSNWRDADSYLGEDLSFRAYFQNAVRGQPGRFYGIGSTTANPATTWPTAWKSTARSSASP
jgi:two-component system sensor histidine kinase AauS